MKPHIQYYAYSPVDLGYMFTVICCMFLLGTRTEQEYISKRILQEAFVKKQTNDVNTLHEIGKKQLKISGSNTTLIL